MILGKIAAVIKPKTEFKVKRSGTLEGLRFLDRVNLSRPQLISTEKAPIV